MTSPIRSAAVAAAFALALAPLQAMTLRADGPAVVAPGAAFDVAIVAEGLGGPGDTLALGGYDFDLVFDPALVGFVTLSFGGPGGTSGLDFGGGSFATFTPAADRVTISEISFESAATLVAAQPATFRLATLTFSAATEGTWTPAFEFVTLADQDGAAIVPVLAAAPITVGIVPEPSSGGLILAGLAWLAASRRGGSRAPSSAKRTARSRAPHSQP